MDLRQQNIDKEQERLVDIAKNSSKNKINEYEEEKKRLKQLTELNDLNKKYASDKLTRQEQNRRFNLSNILGINIGAAQSEIKKSKDIIKSFSNDISKDIMTIVTNTKEWGNLTEDEANAVSKAFSEITKTDDLAEWNNDIVTGKKQSSNS